MGTEVPGQDPEVRLPDGISDPASHSVVPPKSDTRDAAGSCSTGQSFSCLPCHLDWKAFQGSCYYFAMDNLTWPQANDSYDQESMHLVVINSQEEQLWRPEE
ncbi:C-type lectin domain family 4 member G-like [Trichechus inunguis]